MDPILYLMLILALLFATLRLIKGPSLVDRILALDVIALTCAAIVAIYSIRKETDAYLDLILIFTLLGFTSSVGFIAALYHIRKSHD